MSIAGETEQHQATGRMPAVGEIEAAGRSRVFLAGGAAALGAALAGASVAVNDALVDYPVLTGQALRYGLAAAALATWARVRAVPLPRPSRRDLAQLTLLALIGLAGFNVFVLAALDHAEPAAIGVIVGGVPIVLAIAAPLARGARPSSVTVAAGVAVALGAGVVQGGGRLSMAAIGLALGALACEVGFTMFAVPIIPRLGPLAVSIGACAVAAALLAAAAPLVHGTDALTPPAAREATAIVVLAVVITAVAFVAWYWAIPVLGTDRTGLFAGLTPVGTLVTAAIVSGGLPGRLDVLGTLVVAAGLTVGLRPRRPGPGILRDSR
jgi:drug/metabolite transporter (DMT)-like permease